MGRHDRKLSALTFNPGGFYTQPLRVRDVADDYTPTHSVSRFPDTMPDTIWPGLVLWDLPAGGTVRRWEDLTDATINGVSVADMNPRGTADYRRVTAATSPVWVEFCDDHDKPLAQVSMTARCVDAMRAGNWRIVD